MSSSPLDDPWSRLRDTAREYDARVAGGGAEFLTPDATRRLYSAAAVVLASVREFVTVAEEIVQQRLAQFPDHEGEGARGDGGSAEPDRPTRFRNVEVRRTERRSDGAEEGGDE